MLKTLFCSCFYVKIKIKTAAKEILVFFFFGFQSFNDFQIYIFLIHIFVSFVVRCYRSLCGFTIFFLLRSATKKNRFCMPDLMHLLRSNSWPAVHTNCWQIFCFLYFCCCLLKQSAGWITIAANRKTAQNAEKKTENKNAELEIVCKIHEN